MGRPATQNRRGSHSFSTVIAIGFGSPPEPATESTSDREGIASIGNSLKTGMLEIALGPHPMEAPELKFTLLFEATLQIVVSAAHRWAVQGHVTAKELAKEPCYLPDTSHPTRHLIDGYFAAQNIVVNAVSDIESLEVIKEILRQGFGMSILPNWVVEEELKAGIFIAFPTGRRQLRQSWGLLRLRGRPVTAIENSFQILCAEATKSWQSAPLKSGTACK
jgi:DNA-binding transcriptional LysR family regulator